MSRRKLSSASTDEARRRSRLANVLATAACVACVICAIGLISPASAQPSSGASAAVPAPYVDRILESGAQQEQQSEQDQAENLEGWSRGLRLDLLQTAQRGSSDSSARGLSLQSFLDTPNYGALSISADLNSSTVDRPASSGGPTTSKGSTWHIDQWAMPLDGGWRANHSLGDVSTVMPSLARGIGRVFVPTSPISGLAGQWVLGKAAELNLAYGEVGLFSGLNINRFDPSTGKIASGGAQFQLPVSIGSGSRTDAGFQLIEAADLAQAGAPEALRTRSSWSTLAWQGQAPWAASLGGSAADPMQLRTGGLRLQGNWLHSTDNLNGAADGIWLDGAWRTDALRHAAGVFRFDPNLRWGPAMVAPDLQGAYWRAETSSRQWDLGWDLETDRSVSGTGLRSNFGNLNGRYRIDTRNTVGATLTLRQQEGTARSLELNWDRYSALGQTQLRSVILRSPRLRTNFVGIDQAWTALPAVTLATSLGVARDRGEFATSSIITWGILSGFSPFDRMTFDASLRGAHGNGTEFANFAVGAVWRLQRNWSLSLRYYEAHGQDPQLTQVVSALTSALQSPFPPVPTARSLQLVLRFEERAGSMTAPLGGTPGSGAGSLDGVVFIDKNENGKRDASEAGVPNVTVVLDGRFVARTDAQGRYEFPFVLAGDHQLQVQSDNVPLPWTPVEREAVKLNVPIRGRASHDFALQSER